MTVRKMGIDRSTTVGQALELFPQIYGTLMSMGLCCVNEDTVMWTMDQLAADIHTDPDELVGALNAVIRG